MVSRQILCVSLSSSAMNPSQDCAEQQISWNTWNHMLKSYSSVGELYWFWDGSFPLHSSLNSNLEWLYEYEISTAIHKMQIKGTRRHFVFYPSVWQTLESQIISRADKGVEREDPWGMAVGVLTGVASGWPASRSSGCKCPLIWQLHSWVPHPEKLCPGQKETGEKMPRAALFLMATTGHNLGIFR